MPNDMHNAAPKTTQSDPQPDMQSDTPTEAGTVRGALNGSQSPAPAVGASPFASDSPVPAVVTNPVTIITAAPAPGSASAAASSREVESAGTDPLDAPVENNSTATTKTEPSNPAADLSASTQAADKTVTPPFVKASEPTLESIGSVPASAEFTWGSYFEAIGILLFLLGALWFVLHLIRRFGKGRLIPLPSQMSRNALRIEAQLPLGQRRGIYVVRFLNTRMVVGVTDTQINLLSETEITELEDNHAPLSPSPHSAQPASSPPGKSTFQQLLDAGRQGFPKP